MKIGQRFCLISKEVCDVPELKRLGFKFSYESYGKSLVDDCAKTTTRKKKTKNRKKKLLNFKRDQITRSSQNEEVINKTKFLKLTYKEPKTRS